MVFVRVPGAVTTTYIIGCGNSTLSSMDPATGTTVLLVEDDPSDAQFVERTLVEHGRGRATRDLDPGIEIGEIDRVGRLDAALDRVAGTDVDVVLLDLGLPDSDGIDTVEAVVDRAPTMPVIVLTGQRGIGVEAIRAGAQDYLVKGQLSADVLIRTIRYAVERERITRELRDRNHRLMLVNEILRSDLRDDVSMIMGWGDQLRELTPPDGQAAVDAVLEAGRHALQLTDTAAELIDVLADEQVPQPGPCDLRPILAAELDRWRRETDANIDVNWRVPQDEPVSVFGTPMLRSVFEQLLENAITHNDHDTPHLTVTVDGTADRVSVAIADNGVGIPDSQKARIRDPDGTAGGRTRIGTGLYLVVTVLERIDGELDIEDNQPRGTVITVTLDRAGG